MPPNEDEIPWRGQYHPTGLIFFVRIERETIGGFLIVDWGIVPPVQLRDSEDSRAVFEGFEFEDQKEEQIVPNE
jgi:hypothetical protein